MQIRHLPRHCCPVLDNVGGIRLASLEYYTMSMVPVPISRIGRCGAASQSLTVMALIFHEPVAGQ